MIILGLTGSIGMGKSTVAAMFADAGVPVFDADAAVHRLQGPAGRVVAAIEAAFPETTGEAGVNRTVLAEAVLGDEAALRRLEGIVHPAVAEERAAFL
ncbi:dephospho-CoA kinase, partial [Sphingomonas bacterium]|uniref:dephospho-CoA kinase n=1 Tax=Sphingomonas bacterium TaxID=1895847 RepID=UPI001576CBE4